MSDDPTFYFSSSVTIFHKSPFFWDTLYVDVFETIKKYNKKNVLEFNSAKLVNDTVVNSIDLMDFLFYFFAASAHQRSAPLFALCSCCKQR